MPTLPYVTTLSRTIAPSH